MQNKSRIRVIYVFALILLCAILGRLFYLQILQGDYYKTVASERMSTNIVEKAPRGEIVDRYGMPLVTNKVGYSLMLQKSDMTSEEINSMLRKLLELMNESGCTSDDNLPISNAPYTFVFEDKNSSGSTDDEKDNWIKNNKYYGKYIDEFMSAETVLNVYKELYKIDTSLDEIMQRKIAGIRYDAEEVGFSTVTPFIVAEDVNVSLITKIKERKEEFKGISVVNNYLRNFEKPGLATHILGRMGKISQEEYEKNKDKDYGYNDMIGKQGIELYAEDYLRGKDGLKGSTKNVNGEEVEVSKAVEPVPGNYVVLTIDSQLQKTVEDSLAANIERIRAQSGNEDKNGQDANAGAAVVIDVNSGDVLASASYPTYDMTEFNDKYEELASNENMPMWNRAVSGTYSPGSTFKPLVAIAALQSGFLTPDEIIDAQGVYKYYADYQPACWIWNEYKMVHGPINVSKAIEVSCNYFFYEIGRRLEIDNISDYAAKLGLGEYTGIELSEEAQGHMATPEYKHDIIKNITSRDWYGGDTLQAAIGQSYSLFTPVQLANYAATIANGGKRYKVNLIKSVRSSVDGSVVMENSPKIIENVDLTAEALGAVKDGMAKVVDEGGSATEIFSNYGVKIGAKTGTAQLGKGSNNAVFIAFAPFDNPQIAVAVVLEHGVRGTNAGYVAKDIFDKYFNLIPNTEQQTQNVQQAAVNNEPAPLADDGLLRD